MLLSWFNLSWFLILFLIPLITISSKDFFQMWFSLEMSILIYIPLMMMNKNFFSVNSALIYFIIQTLASMILFLSILNMSKDSPLMLDLMMPFSLILKLGIWPLFFWLPLAAEMMNWSSLFLLLTWQKIIPLFIMSMSQFFFFSFILLMTSIVGIWGLWNNTSMRQLLAYSSMVHIPWIMVSFLMSNLNWLFYFLFYLFISSSIFYFFSFFNSQSMNQFKLNKLMSIFLMMCLFSLSGLPPFSGFLPKFLILKMNLTNALLMMISLVFLSLASIYIYSRIMWPFIFKSFIEKLKLLNFSIYPLLVNFMPLFILLPLLF